MFPDAVYKLRVKIEIIVRNRNYIVKKGRKHNAYGRKRHEDNVNTHCSVKHLITQIIIIIKKYDLKGFQKIYIHLVNIVKVGILKKNFRSYHD